MAKSTEHSPDDPEESQTRMTFGEHLDELRKRILRALFGALVPICVCVYFYDAILRIITRPYLLVAQAHNLPGQLATLKPQEGFLTTITLAFQTGLLLASPWIIFQLWQFVGAGLFPRERKIIYRYTAPSTVLFFTGVAFFYFIVLPMSMNFFMTFAAHTAGEQPTATWMERKMGLGKPPASTLPATVPGTNPVNSMAATAASQSATAPSELPFPLPVLTADPPKPAEGQAWLYVDARDLRIKLAVGDQTHDLLVSEPDALFNSMWRFDDYLSFVMFTALVFGLAFELPMVVLILAQTGIVKTKSFRSFRKYAYFIIVVIAVILAPSGDPMTLALLSVPLLVLYELGILAAAIVVRRKEVADT